MEFATWEPVYEAIRADMGYDRAADEGARDRLADLVGHGPTADFDEDDFSGEAVAVAAPGPPLERDLDAARAADRLVAAGVAADRLLSAGVEPDWVVTDLDGHPDSVPNLTRSGPTVAVQAHGDNVDLLEAVVPDCNLGAVLPTTQVAPVGPVRNVGGFTDGDRAAFLADALGARCLTFPGWDLSDRGVRPAKRRKLDWAMRLLAWLERRRGERYAVLDGHRADLDLSAIPGLS